jgi:hypothetical protein
LGRVTKLSLVLERDVSLGYDILLEWRWIFSLRFSVFLVALLYREMEKAGGDVGGVVSAAEGGVRCE